DAKGVLENLRKFGRVPRPWLGLITQQVTPSLSFMYSLPADRGLLILNLVAAAPAERGGLRAGDIITEISGKKIKDVSEIERELSKLTPKDFARLTIQRGGRTIRLEVKLEEFPPQLNRVREGVI
ncbi:PDZ domain-containing protein, partial [bacterium]|nr:PDZ domain-containing protein [bacterium]